MFSPLSPFRRRSRPVYSARATAGDAARLASPVVRITHTTHGRAARQLRLHKRPPYSSVDCRASCRHRYFPGFAIIIIIIITMVVVVVCVSERSVEPERARHE